MNKKNFSRIISFTVIIATVFAVVMVTGCISGDQDETVGEDATTAPVTGTGITGNETVYDRTWILKSVYDSETGDMLMAGDVSATLVLGKDGKMSGNSGCNNFFGDYELKGDEFKAGLLGSTKMACTDESTALIESKFLENLEKASFISNEKDTLVFYDSDKELILKFDNFFLEDYEWELVSINTGDAVVSVPANTTVTMSFDEGRITGNAGCNSYFADYITDGISKIEFGPAGSTEMYCMDEDTMETEYAYLTLIGEVKTYSFSGGILTFTDGEGVTLLNFIRMS